MEQKKLQNGSEKKTQKEQKKVQNGSEKKTQNFTLISNPLKKFKKMHQKKLLAKM
jgi:hypothetical protein